jgi:hypothetical protein
MIPEVCLSRKLSKVLTRTVVNKTSAGTRRAVDSSGKPQANLAPELLIVRVYMPGLDHKDDLESIHNYHI